MITKRIPTYRKAIFLLFMFISYHNSWGQIENNIWQLVEKVKIDFNDSPPLVSYGHSYTSDEGVATVCDDDGTVFFTATDIAIYDNSGGVIDNGGEVEGSASGSSAQSPVVLQNPANPTEYFIFYIADHINDATVGNFKYSILETCIENNELAIGEVKNVQIAGNYSERLHIVEIDKGNYWVLTTEIFKNKIYAFKVDENGLDPDPVVSNLGGEFDGQIGKLSINNSKNMLAWSSTFGSIPGVKIMDFDISTGKVENPKNVYSGSAYGLVWSPNDMFLYFTDIFTGSEGCTFEAEIATISVNNCIKCEFYIPNIIATNSTNNNDRFLVKSNHEECLKDINISIFDRWGNMLFKGTASEAWDGHRGNVLVEAAVYGVHITGSFEGTPIAIVKDLTVIH